MKIFKINKLKTIILVALVSLIGVACSKKFPASEFELGRVELSSAYDLCIDGNYAYVTHNEGLAIINISNLNGPVHVSTVNTDEAALGVFVENNIVFLGSGGNNNFKIVDVSNKNNPIVLSTLSLSGAVYDFAKNGNILFLSTWTGELYVLDVSNFSSPAIISNTDCNGSGPSLAYHNNTIYYANGQRGLQRIDVSDPTAPILSSNSFANDAWDIHIANDHLYLGQNYRGFSIYEVGANNSLSRLSNRNNNGETWGVYQEGDRLYIADLHQGVEIWDISNKNQPTIVTTIGEYAPHDIAVRNGIIFLADQDRSFVILEM